MGGRGDHLFYTPAPQFRQGGLRPGAQGAAQGPAVVLGDVLRRQLGEGLPGKIEAQGLVILLHREGEHLPVLLRPGQPGQAPFFQHPVHHLDAERHIVEQGAVPIPHHIGCHGIPPVFSPIIPQGRG